MRISEHDAALFLRRDIASAEKAVRSAVTVPLTQDQFDALVSFTNNVGSENLRSSTLLRLLNRGDYNSVPEQLQRWVKGGGQVLPGLVERREKEAALFSRS